MVRLGGIRRLLVANRGEIAIRVFYAEEDGYRFETDERYCTGKGRGSAGAYLCEIGRDSPFGCWSG